MMQNPINKCIELNIISATGFSVTKGVLLSEEPKTMFEVLVYRWRIESDVWNNPETNSLLQYATFEKHDNIFFE